MDSDQRQAGDRTRLNEGDNGGRHWVALPPCAPLLPYMVARKIFENFEKSGPNEKGDRSRPFADIRLFAYRSTLLRD